MQLREMTTEDFAGVSALTVPEGWPPFDALRWRRDWEVNPALLHDPRPVTHGWVAEKDGRIVGFMGNVVQRYRWRGRTLRAACAAAYVVHPDARKSSIGMMLARRFAKQPNVELLLATTASLHVPQILQMLKFDLLPVPEFDVGDYWVPRGRGLIDATLRRKGCPPALAAPAAWLGAPLLWAEGRLRGRRPRRAAGDPAVESIEAAAIGEEFDALWREKTGGSDRIWCVRDAEALRWHFSAEFHRPAPRILVARDASGGLLGYAALYRNDKHGLTRRQVADMLVRDDDPRTVRALLDAAYAAADEEGVMMLEIIGHPDSIRGVVRGFAPRPWKKPGWPFLYRGVEAGLHEELAAANRWYPTLMDGDGTLP